MHFCFVIDGAKPDLSIVSSPEHEDRQLLRLLHAASFTVGGKCVGTLRKATTLSWAPVGGNVASAAGLITMASGTVPTVLMHKRRHKSAPQGHPGSAQRPNTLSL